MANTKISQLPSYTGTAADLRWFVMNNSGETETSKFSGYTSPYKIVGTNNTNNIYDTTAMGGTFGSIIGGSSNTISSGINNAIIGGASNTNTSTRGVVVGGAGNNASGTSNIVGGENNNVSGYVAFAYGTNNTNSAEVAFIGGGASCNIAGQTIGIIGAEQATTVGATNVMKQSFIGGGFQNSITTSLRASIIAGQNNSITSSPDSAIVGGTGNTISGRTNVVMVGTSGRTATASNTTYVENLKSLRGVVEVRSEANTNVSTSYGAIVLGGNNNIGSTDKVNLVVGYDNNVSAAGSPDNVGNIVLGRGNNLSSAFGVKNFVVGGYNVISQSNNIRVGNNGTISGVQNISGGEQNIQAGGACIAWGDYITTNGNYQQSFGNNNDITTSTAYQGIYGGLNNSISSTSSHNYFLGGSGNTITSGTNVIGIGLDTRTGLTQSNTTFVENSHAFRTYSTTVQPVSSGTTFTCNLNNGGKAQFYLTGATTIDITNVRDGQSFLIKTQTDGGHTITWTSTGYTFVWQAGQSNPGNNKTDLFRFEVFGNVIYGQLLSDFS